MSVCRFCQAPLVHEFIDLMHAPPSNSFLWREQLSGPETYWPLQLHVCDSCFLVQLGECRSAGDIFSADYVYYSSYSQSWLAHCREYADRITDRLGLSVSSQVIEIASNDGYLLQFFQAKGIPALGIEPTSGTAAIAAGKGIETLVRFFDAACARDLLAQERRVDLLVANNVLAHVPDINDFVSGLALLLRPGGVFTGEFPHLLKLVEQNQFDTIYHEHFSYFSFLTIRRIFAAQGLCIFDVEELPTHGGSLRIYAAHGAAHAQEPSVEALLAKERERGVDSLAFYAGVQHKADLAKRAFLAFLLAAREKGHRVAAYGAAAKGNTLLNYCGIKRDLIDFVVDASPHKQGKYLPGSHVPVVSEDRLREARPDYVVIFPWNLREEITRQLAYVRDWGAKFVVAIPNLEVF